MIARSTLRSSVTRIRPAFRFITSLSGRRTHVRITPHGVLARTKQTGAVPVVQCLLATPVCLDVDQFLGLLDQGLGLTPLYASSKKALPKLINFDLGRFNPARQLIRMANRGPSFLQTC